MKCLENRTQCDISMEGLGSLPLTGYCGWPAATNACAPIIPSTKMPPIIVAPKNPVPAPAPAPAAAPKEEAPKVEALKVDAPKVEDPAPKVEQPAP